MLSQYWNSIPVDTELLKTSISHGHLTAVEPVLGQRCFAVVFTCSAEVTVVGSDRRFAGLAAVC